MMTQNDVLIDRQENLGIITLNRPHALNAITLQMINRIQRQLIKWENDDGTQAVLIKGCTPKSFCAGGDLKSRYFEYFKSYFWSI